MHGCLIDWNLDIKISCLTVDNCTTNDAMVEILLEKLDSSTLIDNGNLFHMRCAAHILNIIVKDGLDVIKVGVEKIRSSVAYWTATPKREEKFEETARQLRNMNTKKLGLDCTTRWNSTYLMLETALLYKEVFTRLGLRDNQYKSLCPSKEEWEFAQDLCGRLKKIYKATEIFSGTKYPTANQCFINICEIRLAITDWRTSSNFMIQTMAEKMMIKFEKYWDLLHGVVGISAVLDPRYKMEVLEFYFEKIFGENSSFKVDIVRDLCYSLLKEYHEKLVVGDEGIGDSTSTRSTTNSDNISEYDLFISTKKRKRVDSIKSELDHYLDEDVVQKIDGFDLLNWWKVNGLKYPNLQRLARDFLAVPASTVASESAFSASGRLVSPHRNRLHPKTLEALMCAQSWLWAAEMQGDLLFHCISANLPCNLRNFNLLMLIYFSGESSIGYATIYNDMELEDSCITREVTTHYYPLFLS